MDTVGRKWPCVIGLALCGGAFILSPIPTNYIGLYFCRSVSAIGILPVMYSPYQIDYVYKYNMGKLQSVIAVV